MEQAKQQVNAGENAQDEAEILADVDQTLSSQNLSADEPLKQTRVSGDLEDEPGDFIRGEIDVKEQMDRTERITNSIASGHRNLEEPEDPSETPGGLEDPRLRRH